MIRPSQQWALQIDITNSCHLHCSNCTRALDHARRRFFMSVDCFKQAIEAVKTFPFEAEPITKDRKGHGPNGRRVIGLIGGEPLLHPDFPAIVDAFCEAVPHVQYRGLWTSIPKGHKLWEKNAEAIEKLVGAEPSHDGSGPSLKHKGGYLNWNLHTPEMNVRHQPILVSSGEVVSDPKLRWQLIEQCWVQREWSSTITPKGFFPCEVAGALDMILDGPGGLPLEPEVWKGDLRFEPDADGIRRPVGKFAAPLRWACEQCGACLPMPARRDHENRDDVSPQMHERLIQIGSPRAKKGDVVVQSEAYEPEAHTQGWDPKAYTRGQKWAGY